MVRKATVGDIPNIVELGKRCQKDSHLPYTVVDDDFEETLKNAIEDHIVFVSDGGFIIVVIVPLYFNKSVTIAQELVWYSEDGSGPSLLKTATEEAKALGCLEIQVGFQNTRKHSWFRKMGFSSYGHDYVMRF